MRRVVPAGAWLAAALLAAACDRPLDSGFSSDRARGHVRMLASTIGSRPAGTEAADRARQYLIDELRAIGFEVRVQSTDARRPEAGLTVHVQNLIAIKEGARREAIALVSHYDSAASSPGAADDALGAAVGVEAARALLQRPLRHTLAVLITDAEELGLMGAAALASDPIAGRLAAYVNLEAVGSGGPVQLFETGPGNAWIVDAWARHAPRPRGGSFAYEIYQRLPNDTDFSMLKRLGVPGLNFASVLDGYSYHTPRDTAERLDPRTIDHAGHTLVRVVEALDREDLSRRTLGQATYFDLLGRSAVSVGPLAAAWIGGAALVLGFVAWVKALRAAIRAVGAGRFVLTAAWSVIGSVLVLAGMIAGGWLLRESREVYHPWYAKPERLFVLTAMMGLLSGWVVARAGRVLPQRARGTRHPVVAWAIALPAWIALAGLTFAFAPAAAYLFLLPLLVAAALLVFVPLDSPAPVRFASLLSGGFNVALWGWLLVQLLGFAVAHFGRQPIVTPAWVYAALMFVAGIVLVPPFLAMLTGRPLWRPGLVSAALLAATAAAAGYAYSAPAYTYERPLRRAVLFAQDVSSPIAFWQVGSVEPGLDLEATTVPWAPFSSALPFAVPIPRLPHPFVFARQDTPEREVPARVTLRTAPAGDAVEFTVSVTPARRGLAVAFVMPAGFTPIRPSLPGIVRNGRWTASYGAVPLHGAAFRAHARGADAAAIADVRAVVRTHRLPGGHGWQGLPAWLPQDRTVWTSEARYIIAPLPEVAPPR